MPSVLDAERDGNRFDPSSWVPLVRPLTPRTRFVTLQPNVVRELTTGTVRVPSTQAPPDVFDTWSDGTPIVEEQEDQNGGDEQKVVSPEMQAVDSAVDEVIKELYGAVCPKLGRSCPFDATWVSLSRTMRCDSSDDVLTLISASECL